jgi:hypothetical protein
MIKRFVITEKTLRLAEKENKITVIVDRTATKKQIADEIRRLYGVFSTWVLLHLSEHLKPTSRQWLVVSTLIFLQPLTVPGAGNVYSYKTPNLLKRSMALCSFVSFT